MVAGQGLFRVRATGLFDGDGEDRPGAWQGSQGGPLPPARNVKTRARRFIVAVLLCLSVVLVYGSHEQISWAASSAGITLTMADTSEEFPVVLTVFLAIGAWRISKNVLLARKVNAVECLGAATVLCSDKTGTITQNKMSIVALCTDDETFHIDSAHRTALPEKLSRPCGYGEFSRVARIPFDPMEKTFIALGNSP